MIRIAQLKLACGHSRADLEKRIRKALRLGENRPLSYEIKRHSIDARKKPQLFNIYTIDADLQMGLKAEKKLVSKLRSKDVSVIVPERYQFPEAGNEQGEQRPHQEHHEQRQYHRRGSVPEIQRSSLTHAGPPPS